MTASIFGLGKLGAPLAAVFAQSGRRVVGVDINPNVVAAINRGEAPVEEPGLAELIAGNRERLSATGDGVQAARDSDISFIIVPTPSATDGAFSSELVLQTARDIGQGLRERDGYHLVVLSSTVMPGTTGGLVLPLLEEVSGKRCGPDFGLCYNPEFIALGSVIRDFLYPDMILIGESDERAGEYLQKFYQTITPQAPVERVNFVNAEVAKISVNTFVTTKIAYANMLAEVCERLDGADAHVVTAALGRDSRIGGKYLKGGLGYGGPCFPRDNVAFDRLGTLCGLQLELTEATQRANRRQAVRVAHKAAAFLPAGGVAAVLGMSYKPDTPVIDESQGVKIALELVRNGARVTVHDPKALPNVRAQLGAAVAYAESLEEAVREADVIVIATAWDEYRKLNISLVKPGAVAIDCWRILPPEPFRRNGGYVTIGTAGDSVSAPIAAASFSTGG